ncbi:hypothetical protein PHMEG_00024810 [Phytophthora megakarya]|uniref:Uncharacterized protein n=1 Tax=Phytophthora megakarya TaxID=4795 RepID=A0A225VF85_9STRA|nr:hypothetical protein PHMEG_00024810 [Phytophthora megakarya]
MTAIQNSPAWWRRLGLLVSSYRDAGTIEQEVISNYATRLGLSLAEIVRLRRGEVDNDSRPNKGLDPVRLVNLLQGYPHVDYLSKLHVAGFSRLGFQSGLHTEHPRTTRVHARRQAKGTYLVVNLLMLTKWGDIHCCPFGAVKNKDVDPQVEVRSIHDLSYPESAYTNDHFNFDSAPDIAYTSVVALALRIEALARKHPDVDIKMLKGDVKSAFRHLMLYAMYVHWMGATFRDENTLVVDLAAPFGYILQCIWKGNFMATDADDELLFGYEWIDDHKLIEPERDDRLELAEATLRLSMLAHKRCNVSQWSTKQHALGLSWDTIERTVSVPEGKVMRCLDRVLIILSVEKVTKQQHQKLLGSLRHLTTCLRSAKPFFQQLHTLNEASRRDLFVVQTYSFGRTSRTSPFTILWCATRTKSKIYNSLVRYPNQI